MLTTSSDTRTAIRVSVIIPAYGDCAYLPGVIAAIKAGQVVPDEIVVSHSGSDDPTNPIGETGAGVIVLHSDARLFAGAARNRGAVIARGKIFAFCDSDVRPDENWLSEILAFFAQNEQAFIVGSVGTARSGGYWGMCNWLSEFSEQAPWHGPRQQNGGASCNMAVRSKDFRSVGGFPEDHLGGEDTILFQRLRAAGLAQRFQPSVRVGHYNISGFRHFAGHQYKLGYHSALVRQRVQLPGSAANRFPPLALLLWVPKVALILSRTLDGGALKWALGAALTPGVVLGTWIWTAGFLKRLLGRDDA